MNIRELRKMADRYWRKDYREDMSELGEARVITGNARNDLFFHRMLVEHGVEMVLKEEIGEGRRQWRLTDYNIVDENKYLMFALKWS